MHYVITTLILIRALLRDRGYKIEKMEEEAEDERKEWQLWAVLNRNLRIIKGDTKCYPRDITARDLVGNDKYLLNFLFKRGRQRETVTILCNITITISGRDFDRTITLHENSRILDSLFSDPDVKIRKNIDHKDRTIKQILKDDVGIEDFKNKINQAANGNETLNGNT